MKDRSDIVKSRLTRRHFARRLAQLIAYGGLVHFSLWNIAKAATSQEDAHEDCPGGLEPPDICTPPADYDYCAPVLACAIDHGNIFVVEDIQQYVIPTSKEIKGVEDSMLGFSKKWVFHKLVSPQTADEIMIEAKCVSGEKCGNTFVFRLKKGGRFSLPYGHYKLQCPNHELTYEEMVSEQNRQRSLPGAELHVPPSNWMPRKGRTIKLYIYPIGSLVDIHGRLVTQEGNGVPNVSIRGAPQVNDPHDIAWYPDVEITTDAKGKFEFKSIPPASLDIAVRFLLFGRIMKPSYNSERLFDFSWRIVGSPLEFETDHLRFKTPLISAKNLKDLLPFVDRLRMQNDRMVEDKLGFVDLDSALKNLPISTNNVIYVGDIMLTGKCTNDVTRTNTKQYQKEIE